MKAKICFRMLWIVGFALTTAAGRAETPWVSYQPHAGDFPLADKELGLGIVYSADDFEVVHRAVYELAQDINRVTGNEPMTWSPEGLRLVPRFGALPGYQILVGTVGHSPLIDGLVRTGKLDVSKIQGQWETYLITTLALRKGGVDTLVGEKGGVDTLVIAGSDRRGTAYGVFELSRAIGVSPWYWWADVAPAHHDQLFVAAGTRVYGPPSVKYRGIFINDEDWSMQPWAAKTFEPERGNIGPKTYAKICELLLRLKANTLWPAMHECSTPFNAIPENKFIADDYGIVMGSSHCEPLLRNNVGEWPTDDQPDFNFLTNPDGVTQYWEQRVKENGQFENLYTIGMRGIHDGPMQGPRGEKQTVDTLEKIFTVQRGLLAKYVNPDPAKVPQIFCPYKEVLPYYLHGLQVPPDVTVVFPDDNFGYLRYLPTPAEVAARPGGFGLYYHISYLGAPFSYVWLDTTPPALMQEELSKAYDHGVRQLWILNVGGLKPREPGIDFFMQMAWDINKWNLKTLPDYLASWATEQFGPAHAAEIAAIMAQYYQLGFQRKPEELQWNLKGEPPRPSDLTTMYYNDEVRQRVQSYQALATQVRALAEQMPAAQQDSFFELVDYPVTGAALANERYFANELSAQALARGDRAALDEAAQVQTATAQMEAQTARYNQLAGGKWKYMMHDDVLLPSRLYRDAALQSPAGLDSFSPSATPGLGVALEGRSDPLQPGETAALPALNPYGQGRQLAVFLTGPSEPWTITPSADWILLSPSQPGSVHLDTANISENFGVTIDWSKAPRGTDTSGNIVISDGHDTYTVTVPIVYPTTPRPEDLAGSFVESDGVVSMNAADFTGKTDKNGAAWEIIPGLSRTGSGSVAIFPTTTPSVDPAAAATDSPVLEYKTYFFAPGNVTVRATLLPTQPVRYGQGLRYAVGFDDEPPQLVTITAGTGKDVGANPSAWARNVLDNATTGLSQHVLATAGPHTLKIYGIDPGVVFDKIVVDAGGLHPSYLGPPESTLAH
jgi:hypothetical protein